MRLVRKLTRWSDSWLRSLDRWIRELVERMREKGDRALVHGPRGRPSPHRIAYKVQQRAVEIVTRDYADFGRRWLASTWSGITESG
jgi:hypothetical protein